MKLGGIAAQLGLCACGVALWGSGCSSEPREQDGATFTTAPLSASATNGSTGSGTDGETDPPADDDDDEILDVAQSDTPPAGPMRCEKMDIVFIVDNSASMYDEQQNLLTSFPGFFSSIQGVLGDDDVRIMVFDTDVGEYAGCYESMYNSFDCGLWCGANCPSDCNCECNAEVCEPFPNQMPCDAQLGAGRTMSGAGADCGLGGLPYFTPDDADPLSAFQCLAQVGITGEPNERPMQALHVGLTEQLQPGACNEGFLRDDALLIVTLITDEDDVLASLGDPADWYDDVVATKFGNPNSVVMIGLLSDSDIAGGTCGPFEPTDNSGASAAPRLREFVESFPFGFWGSVCAPDFSPIFNEAISAIDMACEDFIPPG